MHISQAEYEQKRSIFDLCQWIPQKISELEKLPDFNALYFERTQPTIKKLLEEAIPISYFGLYNYKPHRHINVTCLTGTQPYDAELEIVTRDETQIIRVEVTTTEDEVSTMHRQALARDGSVHLTGAIKRDGRKIITQPKMVDLDVERKAVINLAYERFVRKIDHGYDENTAILVYITSHWDISVRQRLELLEKTRKYLRVNSPGIYGVYYCYYRNDGIDGIQNRHLHVF
jgi:hypothetical protein